MHIFCFASVSQLQGTEPAFSLFSHVMPKAVLLFCFLREKKKKENSTLLLRKRRHVLFHLILFFFSYPQYSANNSISVASAHCAISVYATSLKHQGEHLVLVLTSLPSREALNILPNRLASPEFITNIGKITRGKCKQLRTV